MLNYLAASGTFWDVMKNITTNVTNNYDTIAKLVGVIVFVVGIALTAWGMISQSRRASHLGWGIGCLVVGASLALAGFTGTLNGMLQNTGQQAVNGGTISSLLADGVTPEKLDLIRSVVF